MSRSDAPRYTGYGRPVFHKHGSRRALVERQDERRAIEESYETYVNPTGTTYDEPLADWERELLEGYAAAVPDTRPTPQPMTMRGFIPGTERQPAPEPTLKERWEARRDAWIDEANKRRDEDQRYERIRINAGLRPTDPAKRVTRDHRIRVTDIALAAGLTNVQTIYLLNTIGKEYVASANSTIATIVANDLIKMVTDREGGGRAFVTRILAENGMGQID